MSTKKILAGVIIGAAAGAVLGILFAPDKGTETRRKIADKTTDLAESFKDEVSGKYNVAKDGINDLIAKGKEKINAFKKQAEAEMS